MWMLVDVDWLSGDTRQFQQTMRVVIRYEKYDQQLHVQVYCIINRGKLQQ